MRIPAGVMAVMVLGCGDSGGQTFDARSDGPTPVDGPTADARPDASPPDAAAPGSDIYVMSTAQVPATSTEVQQFGQDIDGDQPDGDAGVDNQLGSVLSALSIMDFDVSGTTSTGIDEGVSIDLYWYDAATGDFHTYIGTNPNPPACTGPGDTVCRHHLDGNGMFDVASGAPTGVMPSTTVGSITTGGPGTAIVQLTLFGSATTLPLIGARFIGTIDAAGIHTAKLAGAVPATLINSQIIPGVGDGLRSTIEADCPTPAPPKCNCALDSTGETLLTTFDANDDCTITNLELENDPLISGFFMPDVTIDGVDGLSFGFRFTAVTGNFTPP